MTTLTAATNDLERLNGFVGVWNTEGEVLAGPSQPLIRFQATDHYEWMHGGHFLLHRFDAQMPEGNVKGIEVIGYDRESRVYLMHSFDSSGNASVMQARTDGGTWTFTGEAVRFTGGFRDDGRAFVGLWEMQAGEGESWSPWMNVRLRKIG